MKLTTKRLILRDLNEEDINVIPSLIDDLEVSKYLAVVPYPYKKKEAKWFVNHCKAEAKKKPRENYELGIVLKENNELIGCIGLTKVNRWDGKATLGYWLGKKYWRLGIMYEACKKILRFAFETLKLQRIDITAAVENEASNSLIKKLGASFEGTAKRYHRSKSTGKYHDANLYGLLKEEYKNE